MEPKRERWVDHTVHVRDKESAYIILVRKSEKKRPL
jgi:hypothetical protein